MEGNRKILATIVALLLVSGAFAMEVLVAKNTSTALFNAYAIAVGGILGVYSGANVLSKKILNGTTEGKKGG